MSRSIIIGVIGGGYCTPEMAQLAEETGSLIAQSGAVLICGGLGGVMEAACRGAKKAGGLTIGVLPGSTRQDANSHIDLALPTGLSDARNVIIARSSDGVIAIDGAYGTLSEIAFCLKFGVPVVGLQTWEVDPNVEKANTPGEAVDLVFQKVRPE